MKVAATLRQFWLRQIGIAIVSALAFAALLSLALPQVQTLPRDALETLFTALATLLGLTFTAFSILATFTPNLRPDFVRSRTFATMGQTFVLTMSVEFVGLLLSGVAFIALGRPDISDIRLAAVFFAILAAGFLAQLIGYMFSLFEMARSGPPPHG